MATADNADLPITYDEFVELVLRYQRTPLLIRCQELAWAIWEKKQHGLSLNDEHICQAHLGTVAAIAAAEASELGRIEATTQDAISLCRQYLRIEERFLSSDRADTVKLGELLRASEVFSIYDIPDEVVGNAALRLFLGRLIRSQWDARVVAYQGIPRTWELLRRFYERLNGDLEARHARVLGIESREFMRAGIALFAQLQRSPKPGFIDVSKQTFEPGVAEALNLSVEALELVADRLARPVDELKAWQSYVGSLPAPDRKYAPSPLVMNPMVRLDASFRGAVGNRREVICPSPSHFIWAIQANPVAALSEAKRPGSKEDLLSELGETLADYLGDVFRQTCGDGAVIDLDELAIDGRRADWAIVDGNRALLVEVKRSVWNAEQKTLGRPEDVVAMWERFHVPCAQIAATISAVRGRLEFAGVDTFLPIACVDDALVFQEAAFMSFGYEAGIFACLGLPGLELLSVYDLENWLAELGPTRLINIILRKWSTPQSRGTHLGNYIKETDRPATPNSVLSTLAAAEADLVGESRRPK